MSEQKNPQVDMYIKAISEQAARERGDLVEDRARTAKKEYELHKKLDKKGYNLKMHDTDGYVHRHSDRADQSYIIRHKSGKVSLTDIDHTEDKNAKDYEESSRMQNKHLSDDEHKEVGKAIHHEFSKSYG